MFERLPGSYLTEPCDDWYPDCTNGIKQLFGFAWKHGAALGYTEARGRPWFSFPSWSPGIWNSVCISASASLGLFSLNINDGEIRFSSDQYEGYHAKYDGSIFLMGSTMITKVRCTEP